MAPFCLCQWLKCSGMELDELPNFTDAGFTGDFFATLMEFRDFPLRNEGVAVDNYVPDFMGDSGLPDCENCNGNNWDCAGDRGDLVCHSCGFCLGGIAISVRDRADNGVGGCQTDGMVHQGIRDAALVGCEAPVGLHAKRRGQYSRQNYLREKFRQWCMAEPPIGPEDWKLIERAYCNYADTTIRIAYFIPTGEQLRRAKGKPIPGCIVLRKEDIRCILHDCDALRRQSYDWKCDPEERKKPSFVTRFLEKWITIRWRFSGQGSLFATAPTDLSDVLLENFSSLQQAFVNTVQAEKIRKTFPSYNTVISRLMEMHGFTESAADLHLLNTKRARRKFEICWWNFCRYLRWPYLSKETFFLTRKRRSKFVKK